MSFIGSMFSNDKGAGFEAQQAPIINQDNLVQNADQTRDQFLNTLGQQQGLADILKAQATGPVSPQVQQLLNNATSNNIASSSGLLASAKGVNPALAARMAGQNAATINQNAAAQGAGLQMQQQNQAQSSLGSLLGNMANQNMGQQNLYQNAIQGQNQANIGNVSQANTSNSGIAQENAKGQKDLVGNIVGGAGAAFGMAGGGVVPSQGPASKVGRNWMSSTPTPGAPVTISPMGRAGQTIGSAAGNAIKSLFTPVATPIADQTMNQIQLNSPMLSEAPAPAASVMPEASQNPFASPQKAGAEMLKGLMGPAAMMGMARGGDVKSKSMVPGKAKVKGDSYANDTVDAKLSPGEIIIPRSIAQGENAPEQAAKFVAAVLAKSNFKKR